MTLGAAATEAAEDSAIADMTAWMHLLDFMVGLVEGTKSCSTMRTTTGHRIMAAALLANESTAATDAPLIHT